MSTNNSDLTFIVSNSDWQGDRPLFDTKLLAKITAGMTYRGAWNEAGTVGQRFVLDGAIVERQVRSTSTSIYANAEGLKLLLPCLL